MKPILGLLLMGPIIGVCAAAAATYKADAGAPAYLWMFAAAIVVFGIYKMANVEGAHIRSYAAMGIVIAVAGWTFGASGRLIAMQHQYPILANVLPPSNGSGGASQYAPYPQQYGGGYPQPYSPYPQQPAPQQYGGWPQQQPGWR